LFTITVVVCPSYGTIGNTRKGNCGIFRKPIACVFVQFGDVA